MAMVEEGEESGAIERNEKELIENVFEFNNTTAEDVMIHRTDMVTLSLDDDEETILSAIRESGLSRFPVYQGNVDDIVGILSTRQYLLNFHVERPQELRALLRPAYFVPETVRADVLFRDMQSKKIHMAVVVDEYGGTEGIATWRTSWRSWWATSGTNTTRSSRSSKSRKTAVISSPAPPTWTICSTCSPSRAPAPPPPSPAG